MRDEFRRAGSELPRLVFSDIMVPHQGPAARAGEAALRMVEAGVDAVGIPLQSDARRANPKLIEDDYLSDVSRAVFERIGKAALVQVVGGLSIAQAKRLAKAALRCFVISGNMGLPDGNARYNLPPADIQRLVAGFIAEVSGGKHALDQSGGAAVGSTRNGRRPSLCAEFHFIESSHREFRRHMRAVARPRSLGSGPQPGRP